MLGTYESRLSEIMKEKGITTQELSLKSGIKVTTINDYRSARKKEPSLSKGLALASALGVDPWELIREKKTE